MATSQWLSRLAEDDDLLRHTLSLLPDCAVTGAARQTCKRWALLISQMQPRVFVNLVIDKEYTEKMRRRVKIVRSAGGLPPLFAWMLPLAVRYQRTMPDLHELATKRLGVMHLPARSLSPRLRWLTLGADGAEEAQRVVTLLEGISLEGLAQLRLSVSCDNERASGQQLLRSLRLHHFQHVRSLELELGQGDWQTLATAVRSFRCLEQLQWEGGAVDVPDTFGRDYSTRLLHTLLASCAQLASLRQLAVCIHDESTALTSAALEPLRGHPSLRLLHVLECETAKDDATAILNVLRSLPQLQSVYVANLEIGEDARALVDMAAMPSLRCLGRLYLDMSDMYEDSEYGPDSPEEPWEGVPHDELVLDCSHEWIRQNAVTRTPRTNASPWRLLPPPRVLSPWQPAALGYCCGLQHLHVQAHMPPYAFLDDLVRCCRRCLPCLRTLHLRIFECDLPFPVLAACFLQLADAEHTLGGRLQLRELGLCLDGCFYDNSEQLALASLEAELRAGLHPCKVNVFTTWESFLEVLLERKGEMSSSDDEAAKYV
jgi:hypothetical protein